MARKSMAELKKHLKNKTNSSGNTGYYPFTKMQENEEAHGRILADPDPDNEEEFYIETRSHKLSIGGKDKWIPCIYMYGDKCPICARSSKYYDDGDEINGKYYYRNLNFLMRMIITKDPLPPGENGTALHTVQKINATKEVIQYVINGIANFEDDEAYPWDLKEGCDFIFKKGTKNIPDPKDKSKMKIVPDYSASTFARKHYALPAEVIAQVEATELPPLKSLRAKHPGLEKILAMLEAHDTGADYEENDTNTQASTQPNGVTETVLTAANTTSKNTTETVEEKAQPAETVTKTAEHVADTPASTPDSDDDIMARIKNRKKS